MKQEKENSSSNTLENYAYTSTSQQMQYYNFQRGYRTATAKPKKGGNKNEKNCSNSISISRNTSNIYSDYVFNKLDVTNANVK